MSKLPDAEEVRWAVYWHLKSPQFTDQLKAIYAEKGVLDERDIPLPAEIYRSIKWAPQTFPCGELSLSSGRRDNAESLGYLDKTYSVQIYWHTNGSDEELVEDEVNRLVRATEDYFNSRGTLLPYLPNASVWLGDEDYAPVINVSQYAQPLIKSGMITLFVKVAR